MSCSRTQNWASGQAGTKQRMLCHAQGHKTGHLVRLVLSRGCNVMLNDTKLGIWSGWY